MGWFDDFHVAYTDEEIQEPEEKKDDNFDDYFYNKDEEIQEPDDIEGKRMVIDADIERQKEQIEKENEIFRQDLVVLPLLLGGINKLAQWRWGPWFQHQRNIIRQQQINEAWAQEVIGRAYRRRWR